MPEDSSEEDFNVFTAGLSKFVRRRFSSSFSVEKNNNHYPQLADGTQLLRPGGNVGSTLTVPDWKNGKGVGGGWDCVLNGDTHFLSSGAERGWLVLLAWSLAIANLSWFQI